MFIFSPVIRDAAALSAAAVLVLTSACSKPVDPTAAGGTSAAPAASATKATAQLGDLTAFRSIAADVGVLVDKGDLPAAKTRIKDLELAWDSAEGGLKPRAADQWHTVDRSIDHALKTVRADSPNQAECKTAVSALLASFDAAQTTL